MAITLNIGLANLGHLSESTAISIAEAILGSMNVSRSNVWESSSEKTLVVELYTEVVPSTIYRTAAALNQDCIAVYDSSLDLGLLIGPRSIGWGHFDKSLFICADGSALEEPF